uniref:Uncharacterized protein n=1 Tax=Caenorhabditis tropicalis TaxID=1561998 RepID=A0A1I7U103_9PELO
MNPITETNFSENRMPGEDVLSLETIENRGTILLEEVSDNVLRVILQYLNARKRNEAIGERFQRRVFEKTTIYCIDRYDHIPGHISNATLVADREASEPLIGSFILPFKPEKTDEEKEHEEAIRQQTEERWNRHKKMMFDLATDQGQASVNMQREECALFDDSLPPREYEYTPNESLSPVIAQTTSSNFFYPSSNNLPTTSAKQDKETELSNNITGEKKSSDASPPRMAENEIEAQKDKEHTEALRRQADARCRKRQQEEEPQYLNQSEVMPEFEIHFSY